MRSWVQGPRWLESEAKVRYFNWAWPEELMLKKDKRAIWSGWDQQGIKYGPVSTGSNTDLPLCLPALTQPHLSALW